MRNFEMQTTAMMEHSRGVAWTANLICDGVTIGTIENYGDGGADRVSIRTAPSRGLWLKFVAYEFGGNEEAATYALMIKEDDLEHANAHNLPL